MAVALDNVGGLDLAATVEKSLSLPEGLLSHGFPIEDSFGPSGKVITMIIPREQMIQLAQARKQCADGTNRCWSSNDLPKIKGARTKQDFDDVGWGGRGQSNNNPHAKGKRDSYDAFPKLKTGQQGTFTTETGCRVTVQGGDKDRGIPRRVVGRSGPGC